MAKRTIRNTDSSETPAPERRRRTRVQEQNSTGEAAPRATRTRRKTTSESTEGTAAAAVASAELDNFALSKMTMDEELVDLPHDQIAVRAYHIYLERGGQPGDDFQDWITAERELRAARNGRQAEQSR